MAKVLSEALQAPDMNALSVVRLIGLGIAPELSCRCLHGLTLTLTLTLTPEFSCRCLHGVAVDHREAARPDTIPRYIHVPNPNTNSNPD